MHLKSCSRFSHNSGTAAGILGGWSGYYSLPGGCVLGNPAAGLAIFPSSPISTYREQVFYVGCDHALYYKTRDPVSTLWSVYTSLGGYVINNPVVGVNWQGGPTVYTEAFVVGSDHAVYYNKENSVGGWSGFARAGSLSVIGDPAVSETFDTANNLTHTELVAVGSDHALYLNRQDRSGTWSGFTRLGGYAISNPALGSGDGRLQIFYVGSDHALYTLAEITRGSGTYSGIVRLGGSVIGNPAVGVNGPMGESYNFLLDVFVIGSDHAVYVNRETSNTSVGTWNGFEKITGLPSVVSDPVVAADNFGQFDDQLGEINVFVTGSDHAVYHISQIGAKTDDWASEGLGGNVIRNPATGFFFAAYNPHYLYPPQFLELYVIGGNQELYYNQNDNFFRNFVSGGPTYCQLHPAACLLHR